MRLLLFFLRCLLSLRYRVTVRGLDRLHLPEGSGGLFLPNHPAYIDPVILLAYLWPRFHPRFLADARQVDRPVVRRMAAWLGVIRIPDPSRDGATAGPAVDAALDELARSLAEGKHVLLYPSGRMMRSRYESLGAAGAAERLLTACPTAMPVVVRTRGLWGSAFSRADGHEPRLGRLVFDAIVKTLASGIFFLPRRRVDITVEAAYDLPRRDGRRAVNAWLEKEYNRDAPPRLYVPTSRWERGGPRVLPDPDPATASTSTSASSPAPDGTVPATAPEAVRDAVARHLRELSGCDDDERSVTEPSTRLAGDLGLDSLAVGALSLRLAEEMDVEPVSPERLATVADAWAAARGTLSPRADDDGADASAPRKRAFPKAERAWFAEHACKAPLTVEGSTLPEALLAWTRRASRRAVFVDGGKVRTHRELLVGIHALAEAFSTLPSGRHGRVGLMLPAGGASLTAYYALLWTGRTPVLFNWTLGASAVAEGARRLDVASILTAEPLIARLEATGMDFSSCRDRFVYVDRVARGLGKGAKLRAAWRGWRGRGPSAPTPETAAILFTSGSESRPKAVPLTHANLLTNVRDVFAAVDLRRNDALLSFLPPFHSFGLLAGLVAPAAGGLRAVYHANPLEGRALASLARRWRATLLVGTPTFAAGIARAAVDGALSSVRLAITGAEACGASARALFAERMPEARVVEGYGITECSPILAVDDPSSPASGSVGRPMASVAWMRAEPDDPTIPLDVDTDGQDATVHAGDGSATEDASVRSEVGRLLVRGPSVFAGYLIPEADPGAPDADEPPPPDPFVTVAGERWFDTGDLIRVDGAGRWYFAGRRKRFVKMGGEMVSLPSVEAALERTWPPVVPEDAGPDAPPRPVVAVVAVAPRAATSGTGTSESHGGEDVALWAIFAGAGPTPTRESMNRAIREAGLSPLHGVKRVARVASIPLLGTGKTDYRALQAEAERMASESLPG